MSASSLREAAFDQFQRGLILLDLDLSVRIANDAARRAVGQSDACAATPPADGRGELEARLAADHGLRGAVLRAAGGARPVLHALKLADGRRLRCELRRLRVGNARPLVALEIIHNHEVIGKVLELGRAVQHQKSVAAIERGAARALQEINEKLTRFAYAAAHDIQEPVRIIAVLSDLLRAEGDDLPPDQLRERLGQLHAQAERARRLVADLLEYSQLNEMELRWSACDLTSIVKDCLRDYDAALQPLDYEISIDDLGVVEGDADRLRTAFANLISNAIKYRRGRRLVLSVEKTGDSDAAIGLVFRDEGIGFEPAEAGAIFETFRRLHRSDEIAGSGVGLSLCKTVIERHNGEIRAAGAPGAGASFHVRLPKRQRRRHSGARLRQR